MLWIRGTVALYQVIQKLCQEKDVHIVSAFDCLILKSGSQGRKRSPALNPWIFWPVHAWPTGMVEMLKRLPVRAGKENAIVVLGPEWWVSLATRHGHICARQVLGFDTDWFVCFASELNPSITGKSCLVVENQATWKNLDERSELKTPRLRNLATHITCWWQLADKHLFKNSAFLRVRIWPHPNSACTQKRTAPWNYSTFEGSLRFLHLRKELQLRGLCHKQIPFVSYISRFKATNVEKALALRNGSERYWIQSGGRRGFRKKARCFACFAAVVSGHRTDEGEIGENSLPGSRFSCHAPVLGKKDALGMSAQDWNNPIHLRTFDSVSISANVRSRRTF